MAQSEALQALHIQITSVIRLQHPGDGRGARSVATNHYVCRVVPVYVVEDRRRKKVGAGGNRLEGELVKRIFGRPAASGRRPRGC